MEKIHKSRWNPHDAGEVLSQRLVGKNIIIYQLTNGKYTPYNLSQKLRVKNIESSWMFPQYTLITMDGDRIELKLNDRIKITGNKKLYTDIKEVDPYGEEDDWD